VGITAAYFYLSIPFLIVINIVAGLGILAALLGAGVLPIYWLMLLGAAVIYTLGALVCSIFTGSSKGLPGRRLPRSQAPEVCNVAEAIAQRLGTQAIDAIYVTPG